MIDIIDNVLVEGDVHIMYHEHDTVYEIYKPEYMSDFRCDFTPNNYIVLKIPSLHNTYDNTLLVVFKSAL
jgi:hypothetical protein